MAMTNYTSKLVATGGLNYGASGETVKLYVAYKSSQNAATNQSTVYVGMYIVVSGGWNIGRWGDDVGSYVGKTTLTFSGVVPEGTKGTYWLVENKSFTVNHNTEGKATATIYWKWGVNSPWGQMVTPSGNFTITLPTIARASSITAYNTYIGESMTININKAASSFTHTLQYKIEGQSAYTNIVVKTSAGSYKFDTATIAEAAYNLMPYNKTFVNCEIRCGTYSGSTLIGITTDTFSLMGTKSALAPTLEPQVTDTNDFTTGLTGNRAIILKYYSKPMCYFGVTFKYNATIKSYKVTNGSKSLNTYNAIFEDGVESNVFTFSVTDTRGLTTTKTLTLEENSRWFETIKPTITISTTSPELVTTDDTTTFQFNMTLKGNCYNGLISPSTSTNAISEISYEYREVGASDWHSIIVSDTIGSFNGFNEDRTSYNITIDISGLDYLKAYEFRGAIKNTLENVETGIQVKKATPIFEWGENDFKFNVPVTATNRLYFDEVCNGLGKGVGFARTDGNADFIQAYEGKLYFTPNYPENTTPYKMCITPGDVITIANNTPFFGLLTGSRKLIIFAISLNKPLVGVTGVTLTGKIQMRGSNGYLYNQSSKLAEKSTIFSINQANKTAEGIASIATQITGQSVIVGVTFNSALTINAAGTSASTNNTCCVFVPDGNLNLTFS